MMGIRMDTKMTAIFQEANCSGLTFGYYAGGDTGDIGAGGAGDGGI